MAERFGIEKFGQFGDGLVGQRLIHEREIYATGNPSRYTGIPHRAKPENLDPALDPRIEKWEVFSEYAALRRRVQSS